MFIIAAVWGGLRTLYTLMWGFAVGHPPLFGVIVLALLAGAAALAVTDVQDATRQQARQDTLADEIAAGLISQAAAADDPGEALDAAEKYLAGGWSR